MPTSLAPLALLLAAAFWGFGNLSQKLVLADIGPFSAVSLRCAIAAAVMIPLILFEKKPVADQGYWKSILMVSGAFTAAITIQQYAYLGASVTNASFLVNTCVVLTPLIAWLALGQIASRSEIAATVIAIGGIFQMSGASSGAPTMQYGDVACLVAALFYAIWMVALGRHAAAHGCPVRSACIQFVMAALFSSPFAIGEMPAPASIGAAAPHLFILGVFTTGAAFGLQTWAQRHTSASRAAVIVSAESIFGALGAFVVLQERPGLSTLAGAGLIFCAILLVCVAGPIGSLLRVRASRVAG
ncbi:DMT family transporter [Rhizobium ruizarguesonis]|uniref:EamA domain-containing protein n=2 Tax=Rhizobium TaxID=379 RepID=A0A179BAB8_RHILE|nr:DMT family transporter [Rhizobium leguminosarum]OAP88638.1 hypothetical protein A4U53_07635 [Rhizobium leguminosarum]